MLEGQKDLQSKSTVQDEFPQTVQSRSLEKHLRRLGQANAIEKAH